MVDIKDQPFPRCIIVVVREALVALGDEAIGADLVTEMKGCEQQEGTSGGAVYSPMGSVQGL